MFAEARRLCAPTLKRGARLPIRAVSYEAAIDQLFKRMRLSSSARTKQAVSTPRGPVPNERRRRRQPHGRRTETTGEWPPVTRGLPPAPAEDGPGRGPPPRGRVRSRCTSRGARTRPGIRRRRRTPGGPRCARGCGRRCVSRAPPAPPRTPSRTAAAGYGTRSRTAWPSAEARPFFFFNETPPTESYTLSLHDALPI